MRAQPEDRGYAHTLPPTLADVRRRLGPLMPELRERFHVGSMGIFGSVARGDAGPNSDVDVLVEFVSAPTLFGLLELEDLLSHRLGARVDLVVKRTLKPAAGKRVLADLVLV